VDQYIVSAQLPAFVGHPAYRNEQLMTWWPRLEGKSGDIIGPIGIFHSSFNLVSFTFPKLGAVGLRKIESRHPAQVLIMGTTDRGFLEGVRALTTFDPTVVRRGVLSHGHYHLNVWLVDLRRYLRGSGSTQTASATASPQRQSPNRNGRLDSSAASRGA
jgi:hypothetical protein